MDQLPIAIRLLLAGLIDGPASVFVGATGGRNISFAASSPAGELAAPSHKTMSQTTWYQNRGPAIKSLKYSRHGSPNQRNCPTALTIPYLVFILPVELASINFPTGP